MLTISSSWIWICLCTSAIWKSTSPAERRQRKTINKKREGRGGREEKKKDSDIKSFQSLRERHSSCKKRDHAAAQSTWETGGQRPGERTTQRTRWHMISADKTERTVQKYAPMDGKLKWKRVSGETWCLKPNYCKLWGFPFYQLCC